MRNDLYLSKIKTYVPGLDDLFYGGLRLPDIRKDKQMDGICIVLYGERGVSKSDLALQIMRGVDRFLKYNADGSNKLKPRFCSLNHRESEWHIHYRGAEVVDMIDMVKAPDDTIDFNFKCKLCSYFKDLRQLHNYFNPLPGLKDGGCDGDTIKECIVCKMIRHGIVIYNTRSRSLHWNVGSMSDKENYIASMEEDSIETADIFNNFQEGSGEGLYEQSPLQILNDMREEVYDAVEKLGEIRDKNRYFYWSSCVIESFTAFSDEDLSRLPYADLIRKLRKASAVSILVFDERGANLHLNADIIIHMRKNVDPKSSYQYQELHIVKSDCQPHVQGWHKFRTVNGLKDVVYPSIPHLLMTRFEIDNAVPRLEFEDMRFPQWLLKKFQTTFASFQKDMNDFDLEQRALSSILSGKSDGGVPYDESFSTMSIEVVETRESYDQLFASIDRQLYDSDTTVSFFLLGKSEQTFRKQVWERNYSVSELKNLHFWEATSAYVWPEIFASVIKHYVNRWKQNSTHKHLHIVVDDFACVDLYPLMEHEPLLPLALVNICQNEIPPRTYEQVNRDVRITLTMVCTSSEGDYYKTLCQLKKSTEINQL